MNSPLRTPLGGRPVPPEIGPSPAAGADLDSVAAVAAHQAMNSLAFIAGALSALQHRAVGAEDRQLLVDRAIVHTALLGAVLHDLLANPGADPTADRDDPLLRAAQRFGADRGVGLDRPSPVRTATPVGAGDASAITR